MANQKDSGKPDNVASPVQSGKPRPKLSSKAFLSFFTNIFASSQNVIGIDIGSSYLKILQLQRTPKGYVITNCITRAIPAFGKDNPAERKKLLQGFVKEFITDSRIKTDLARIALSGKGIFIFSLIVPAINKKDLKGLVGMELKKRLPFQLDINNISFDYFVTGTGQDEKGQTLQITCIAADRLAIEEQIAFLKEINIRPVSLHVVPDALGNLLSYCVEPSEDKEKTVTLLEIGASTSLLNFYKARNLVFSREIPLGGDHVTQAMARSITTPAGKIDISLDDAEKLKRNFGIPLEDEAKTEYLTDFGIILGEQISTMLRPTLERLILEITRTTSYYSKTFKSEGVEELYITGGSSRLRNIDKFLLYNLEKLRKVERLDILKAVKGWADTSVFKQELVMEQAAPHLAVAFGLCLGAGGKVNLLPMKEKIEQQTIFLKFLLRVFFPVIFGLVLSLYGINYMHNLKYGALVQKMREEIKSLDITSSKAKEYLDMKIKLEERKGLLEKARGRQPLWSGIFKELSNITPAEAVLKRITTTSKGDYKEVFLKGRIIAKYTIVDLALSQYLMGLEESPYFGKVELISSEKDMFSPVPAANFEISCRLTY